MIYPWQHAQWVSVQQQLSQRRLPHALLLVGAEGLGKLDFAIHLAKTLLCEKQSIEACDDCHACHLFSVETHPDFFQLSLLDKSKVIKVDQVREVIQKTTEAAHQGVRQVVVIDRADCMHPAAANAILKTLEEPTGEVVFILVASQLGSLPATVLSRCLKLSFSVLDQVEAKQWLGEKLEEPVSVDVLLQMANGSPLKAVALAGDDHLAFCRDMVEQVIAVVDHQQCVVDVSASLTQKDLPVLYTALTHLFKSVLRMQAGCHTLGFMDGSMDDRLRYLANRLSVVQAKTFSEHIMQAWRYLNQASPVNLHLLLESALCSMEAA